MALPLPSSLPYSRLRPKGICGFGTPLPSEPNMKIGLAGAVSRAYSSL